MTSRMRRPTKRVTPHAQRLVDHVHALAGMLLLKAELKDLREQVQALDDSCMFFESVHGPESKAYRKAAHKRNMLLLQADQLLTHWVTKRVDITAATA